MRNLVTLRTIDEILPHPNADALELAMIGGWQVCVKMGEFQSGDLCLFFEIDSFLPVEDERFGFLIKNGVKKDEAGKERIRLRTVKLRKELSQGLALPWHQFPELHEIAREETDFSEHLDVIKYERPEPKAPNAAGSFPVWIQKTDEERIQNLWNSWKQKHSDVLFVPTLKLDGSSCTVAYVDNPDLMVEEDSDQPKSICVGNNRIYMCSRNMMLKYDANSHFWEAPIARNDLDLKMDALYRKIGRSFAIQGEVIGPGIQGNKEKVQGFDFFAFNVYDIENQRYFDFFDVIDFFEEFEIKHVPILGDPIKVFQEFESVQQILEHANGPSLNAKIREGIVWKSVGENPPISFKCISNQFLLKSEE